MLIQHLNNDNNQAMWVFVGGGEIDKAWEANKFHSGKTNSDKLSKETDDMKDHHGHLGFVEGIVQRFKTTII